MDTFIPIIALAAIAWKLVDFVKFLRSGDWNAVVSQLATWVAGIAVVVLGAQADVVSDFVIPGVNHALGDLDFASQVMVGMSFVGSVASVGYDLKKAVDGTDSAKTPPLTTL